MQNIELLNCSKELGNCCNDYGLAAILDVIRKFFDILQILAPIILITMTIIIFVKMTINPDMKNAVKKIHANIIAAIIIFFIPVILNTVMNMLPGGENFQVAACWQQASQAAETMKSQPSTYIKQNNRTTQPVLPDPSEYDKGVTTTTKSTNNNNTTNDYSSNNNTSNYSNSSSVSNGPSSATGQAIVNYASQFVGQKYVYGGSWNGEYPYTPTDCSGFVQGVFRHHGIKLNRTTSTQWADTSKYTLVSHDDIRAGDVIMYTEHVGILTGNGTEIIHAKGSKWGVVKDPDYRTCSSHKILGIMRIKGVN